MESTVSIVSASHEDLHGVQQVEHSSFVKADWWSVDLWKGMLKSFCTKVIIAISTSGIIGFVVLERRGKVMKLGVNPAWQRKGIGSQLLDAALIVFDSFGEWQKGCYGAVLHVESSNVAAVSLYNSRGFKKDCLLKDYYGIHRDAWRMLRNQDLS